jgi:elongation factor P
MMTASDLRTGLAVRIEGAIYKLIEVTHHAGQGKMGGVTHVKLRHLDTGTIREWRFRADEPVDDMTPERQQLQFLYSDDRLSYFMHPETFEQVEIDNRRLGRAVSFLTDGAIVPIEFVDNRPVAMVFPDVIDAKVAETAPPRRAQGGTNVWKEATLENGLRIMVPPFIAPGETIRVDVEQGTYVERAHKK